MTAQQRRKPTVCLVLAVVLGHTDLLEWALSCFQQRKSSARRERLFEARLEEEREESICSITKGLETVKNREQKYHSRRQSWWEKKSFSLCRAGIYPFLFKKFCFSCRLLQNWFAACSYSKCPKGGHCLDLYLLLLVLPQISLVSWCRFLHSIFTFFNSVSPCVSGFC